MERLAGAQRHLCRGGPAIAVLTQTSVCSQRFLAALQQPVIGVAALAEVWNDAQLLASFQLEPGTRLTVNRANASRRQCTAILKGGTFADGVTPVVPSTVGGLLYPVGNELRLYRGIAYSDGSGDVELVRVGVFGMEDVDIAVTGSDTLITLTGFDRARAVGRAGFTDAYTIAPNTNLGTALQTLIASRPVGFTQSFAFVPVTFSTGTAPIVYNEGDDPWAKATELAASYGCALYYDRAGTCILAPVPDPSQSLTSWSYTEGAGNLATSVVRHLSRKDAPNYIIRSGQGSGVGAPVRAVAFDNNPASQTYIGGSYGVQTNRKVSSLYTTTAQAQAAADADLLLALGKLESIDLRAIPKPDTDVDSVIGVTATRAGIVSGRYVVDSLTMGFSSADTLDLTGRLTA